jgi:hypothetical protein
MERVHLLTSILIEGIIFNFVAPILPEETADGKILEFAPAIRYLNVDRLPLHKYGSGPFCRFRIGHGNQSLDVFGVYAIVGGASRILYVGKCAGHTSTLGARFNSGHGQISPRNCFKGGQSTNCHVNMCILQAAKNSEQLSLFFHVTSDGFMASQLEHNLIRQIGKPPWNLKVPGAPRSRLRVENIATPVGQVLSRVNGMSTADLVRSVAIEQYFNPARSRNEKMVTISVREMHDKLGLSKQFPNVCQALRGEKLQIMAKAKLLREYGPKLSSTTSFLYCFV